MNRLREQERRAALIVSLRQGFAKGESVGHAAMN
jgi:hypothetical protein